MARYLISAIGVNTGAIDVKRAGFGSILEQRETVHKDGWNVATSQRRNVATSQRCDVATLGQLCRSQQAATSRCLNVVTSQRRDVATSRRQSELCLSIIKSKKGDQNSRHRGSYELGHGNQSSGDIDLDEEPVIWIFFAFFWTVVLMFDILRICIFLFSMF